ncbi:MAG: metal ABC transporter permease [Planctomycetota bacterium]|nr:metal ABC transporter permease [Planctomycetota bacterium]
MIEDFGLYWELFATSFLASVVVGVVMPQVGGLMYLRRESFLGIAVPQFAAAGVALGLFFLPGFPTLQERFLDHGHPPLDYLLVFAAGAACVSMLLFSIVLKRQLGEPGALLAGAFATAAALAILFLDGSPAGNNLAETVLRGAVLLLDEHGLWLLTGVCLLTVVFIVAARRTLLAIAFDRDNAIAMRLPVAPMELAQMLLFGLAIGGGVMTVGPVLVFGLLFLPPLAASCLAHGLRSFQILLSIFGFFAVMAAWPLSIELDLPYGPSAVVSATALTLLGLGLGKLLRRV